MASHGSLGCAVDLMKMTKLAVVFVHGCLPSLCNQEIDSENKVWMGSQDKTEFDLRYKDGVQWHDMPCYFRSKIICEDSELQMNRIKKEMGVDVSIPITSDNF